MYIVLNVVYIFFVVCFAFEALESSDWSCRQLSEEWIMRSLYLACVVLPLILIDQSQLILVLSVCYSTVCSSYWPVDSGLKLWIDVCSYNAGFPHSEWFRMRKSFQSYHVCFMEVDVNQSFHLLLTEKEQLEYSSKHLFLLLVDCKSSFKIPEDE